MKGSKSAARLAVCVLTACLLVGCTSVRNSLGTSDSSCYIALPTAARSVGPHSKLIGVHQFTVKSLSHKAPTLYRDLAKGKPSSQRLCVIAFVGTFTRSSVEMPFGRTSGQLAVVVTEAPSNRLLGTVIFLHAPLQFEHNHIG
jgi:hypothetical protein